MFVCSQDVVTGANEAIELYSVVVVVDLEYQIVPSNNIYISIYDIRYL